MLNNIKPDYINEDIEGYKKHLLGYSENAVEYYMDFYKDSKLILRLGVDIALGQTFYFQFGEQFIYEWIWNTGNTFVNELNEEERLIIQVSDVQNTELITPWQNLEKEKRNY